MNSINWRGLVLPDTYKPLLENKVIAILGPTAVGKSTVGHLLAKSLNGEIVSADSMQIYRGMDIGTAKASPARRSVRYHCIDLVDPGESFSAALYQNCARQAIFDINSRGRTPFLVGGTGLYVRAALDDFIFPAGDISSESRLKLEAEAEHIGSHALHNRLADIDPESAKLIHPNNLRRTVRALEMAEQGISYAEHHSGFADYRDVFSTIRFGLTMERTALYQAIEARVESMIESGLLDEIAILLDRGFRETITSAQAIGYKEFVPMLEGRASLSEATSAVVRATRRYAKRQISWFRRDGRILWIDITGRTHEDCANEIAQIIESNPPMM